MWHYVVLNPAGVAGVNYPGPFPKRISAKPENRCVVVTEAGSYLRLIDFVALNLRLKDLLRPVTRVKKKKKKDRSPGVAFCAPWGRPRQGQKV